MEPSTAPGTHAYVPKEMEHQKNNGFYIGTCV